MVSADFGEDERQKCLKEEQIKRNEGEDGMYTEWQPRISVIIPIYNAELYLKQCLESVVGQTYHELGIFLVDDGSTDGSSEMCDAYMAADARVKVIHKENEGLVRARKTGVSQATGEYITYVDADDWIDLDMYENILRNMTEQDADMVLYGMIEEYEDQSVTKENLLAEGHYAGDEIKTTIFPGMLCKDFFFHAGILPNLVCKLVKRELLRKIQPLVSDEVEMGEDADCTFQMLLQAENIQILRYTPYHYRKRHDSMVRGRTDFSQSISLYGDLKKAFEKSAEREMLMPQLYRYMLFVLLLKETERFMGYEAFAGRFSNKRIVLYGAGGFGQELYRALTDGKRGEVVCWADRRYQVYRELGLPVSAPEEIAVCAYDMVFIAVLDTQVCGKIAADLIRQGVEKEKINYIEPAETDIEILLSILETGSTA